MMMPTYIDLDAIFTDLGYYGSEAVCNKVDVISPTIAEGFPHTLNMSQE